MLPKNVYQQALRDNYISIQNNDIDCGKGFINISRIIDQAIKDGYRTIGEESQKTKYFTRI